MSNYDINSNPDLIKLIIGKYKAEEEKLLNNPDSVLPRFKQELLNMGFEFQVLNQAESLLPKNKELVLPIVIKYYKEARLKNEKRYLLTWFCHSELEEVIPMLLADYRSSDPLIDRWAIGDCLYQIHSKKYIADYLKIISDPTYGQDRQMVVLLVGKLKVYEAIPVLISLLDDEGVRLQAIIALGNFKQENLRQHFERFQNSDHAGWRKYSRAALKKLDN